LQCNGHILISESTTDSGERQRVCWKNITRHGCSWRSCNSRSRIRCRCCWCCCCPRCRCCCCRCCCWCLQCCTRFCTGCCCFCTGCCWWFGRISCTAADVWISTDKGTIFNS